MRKRACRISVRNRGNIPEEYLIKPYSHDEAVRLCETIGFVYPGCEPAVHVYRFWNMREIREHMAEWAKVSNVSRFVSPYKFAYSVPEDYFESWVTEKPRIRFLT